MKVPTCSIASHALGLGLRTAFYSEWEEHADAVDYLEIISENFMGPALPPRQQLDWVRRRHPIVLHGVGLNILGHEPLDEQYLDQLCRLADHVDAPFVSDHLCWTGAHGQRHHDLLPMPYTNDLIDYVAERAAYVQRRLGRPFALENLSSYVQFPESTMPEWDFYQAIIRNAGIYAMLDINNIYVSSQNHDFDARTYLQAIDFSRVLQVHLAGHEPKTKGLIIDTHDRPVAAAVWELYRYAWQLGGPFPTLLEWDDRLPALPVVIQELHKARTMRL